MSKTESSSSVDKNEKPKGFRFPIEPVIVAHMVSALLGLMAIQDVLLEKACRINFAYSDEVCTALELKNQDGFGEEEEAVQKYMGPLIMWRMITMNVFPIVLVFLYGSWSDKYGRKVPILMVLLSFVLYHLILVASTGIQVGAGVIGLLTSGIVSLGGSNAVFGMAVFSYIADTTPKEKMSQKTAVTGMCFFLGLTLGLMLRGVLASMSWTLAQVFWLGAGLEAFAFLYLLLLIENVRDEKAIKGITTGQMVQDLFKVKHITDSITSVFKKRTGNDRLKLILLLMCHALVMTPLFGEGGIIYLYTRYKFNWDAGAFATFMTYKTLVGFAGNFVSMAVLTRALKLTDPAVGIVSCASLMISSFIFAFITSPVAMYVGPVVAIFSGSITSVARSIMFKIIPKQEIGKVNSFIGSLESFTQLAASPAYTTIYMSTIDFFPGCFFLLSAAAMLPPIFVYMWLRGEDKKGKSD